MRLGWQGTLAAAAAAAVLLGGGMRLPLGVRLRLVGRLQLGGGVALALVGVHRLVLELAGHSLMRWVCFSIRTCTFLCLYLPFLLQRRRLGQDGM